MVMCGQLLIGGVCLSTMNAGEVTSTTAGGGDCDSFGRNYQFLKTKLILHCFIEFNSIWFIIQA